MDAFFRAIGQKSCVSIHELYISAFMVHCGLDSAVYTGVQVRQIRLNAKRVPYFPTFGVQRISQQD